MAGCPNPNAIRLWIEVDLEATPIRGTLKTPDGEPSVFTGWLGLTSALEALRAHGQARQEPGEERLS